MVCGTQILAQSSACLAGTSEDMTRLLDGLSHENSRLDLALPAPLLELERDISYTEYNENTTHEWSCQRPAFMYVYAVAAPAFIMPYQALPLDLPCFATNDFTRQFVCPEAATPNLLIKTAGAQGPRGNKGSGFKHAHWGRASSSLVDESRQYQLLADLQGGGAPRDEATSFLRDRVPQLSFDRIGCRVVQLAIEVSDTAVASDLARELAGHVQKAMQSPHANHVVQKIVEVLPVSQTSFVANELRGDACAVARHKHGCRILCRIFEHSASSADSSALADELMCEAADLCCDMFATHPLQAILKHGLATHQRQIRAALLCNLGANVHNKSGSFAIEAALSSCEGSEQQSFIASLLEGGSASLAQCVRTKQGIHVVRALMKQQGEHVQALLEDLLRLAPHCRTCRTLLEDVNGWSLGA